MLSGRKWLIWGVALAVVISAIPGIVLGKSSSVAASEGSVALKIAFPGKLPNFNYFDIGSNSQWKQRMMTLNFESIMGEDYDGSAFSLLAESINYDPNSLAVTIHLRQNVRFHDGVEMTAKDVIFSYCALRHGTTISGSNFIIPFDDNQDGIVSYNEITNHITYVDNYTVTISSRQPYNFFFLGTLGIPIIPEHIWKDHLVDVDGQGTTVDEHGYTHGAVDTSWNNDPAATIGTGPWMYGGGIEGSYRIERHYDGYWGKNFQTPMGFRLWNPNMNEIWFIAYSNLNSAIVALQTGEVDYITATLGADKASTLKNDPNIELHYLADRGYFYLAFNEKRYPANYIAFRHAVSHVIDKQTAVERYLGGFGMAGDSTEPPFFDAWYNQSVQHYPYNVNTAKKILDGQKVVADNGYVEQDPAWGQKFVDVDGDGWRDLPDGSPMKPITLFTPPADYDPVRIKIGQGIAQNLRSIGVNIQAKPVDFDTLVSYMQSYNYVMLELGWSLSDDPIGNLADIYGPHSIQNTWGWWNASNPNPYYVNAGGVQNTCADKFSQDYATLFDNVINKAMTTFDVDEQIKYTKWAQDIIAKATVVNVLYYLLNAEATSESWSGWIEWHGTVFNKFSIAYLDPKSSAIGNPANMYALVIGETQIPLLGPANYTVRVVDGEGNYVANAKVNITGDADYVSLVNPQGYTDERGFYNFTVVGIKYGVSKINIQVSHNDYTPIEKNISVVIVGTPKSIHIEAFLSNYSLSPGDSTEITVRAVDSFNHPIPGVSINVDSNILNFGSITPTYATTDSYGNATFTYTAPSESDMAGKYSDMHAIGQIVFSASKTGYEYSNTLILRIATYNNVSNDWHIYRIVSASQFVVSPALGWNVTIEIQSLGANENPIPNDKIQIVYSNQSYIASGPTEVVTNDSGIAKFNVTFSDDSSLTTAPIYIEFTNYNRLRFASDRLVVLYYDGHSMPSTELYGGMIQIMDPFHLENNSRSPVVVTLYDKDGNPAAAGPNETVPLAVVVSGTTDGQLVDLYDVTNFNNYLNDPDTYLPWFNSGWYLTGIGIYTPYDNIATCGDFIGHANETPNPYDIGLSTFNETGVVPGVLHNGTYVFYLLDSMSSYRDLKYDIFVVPYGDIYLYISDPSWSFYQFNITGMQVLHSQGVISRASHILISVVNVDPIATAGEKFNAYVNVRHENNTPANNVTVQVYNNLKSWKSLFPKVMNRTDENGSTTLSPVAPKLSFPREIDVYAIADTTSADYSTLASTQVLVVPKIVNMRISTDKYVVSSTKTVNVTGYLSDSSGAIVNKTVELYIGNLYVTSAKTDDNGTVKFTINIGDYVNRTMDNTLKISLKFSEPGYFITQAFADLYIHEDMKIEKVNYPEYADLYTLANISVKVNTSVPIKSVMLYIKYPNEADYEGYQMLRVSGGSNEFYLNKYMDREGAVQFYIVVEGYNGLYVASKTYNIQVGQAVPEFNVPLFTLVAIAAIVLVGSRRKH